MYYIYHIPGIKIGCTKQEPNKRVEQQGYENYEILETHEDGWYAGDRELILQKEYGYPVDNIHYMQTINASGTLEAKIKIANTLRGRTMSLESSIKKSNATKGIPKPKLECPYCQQLIGGTANLNQHINNKHKKGL